MIRFNGFPQVVVFSRRYFPTDTFSHRYFFPQILFPADTFSRRFTQILLRRFTQIYADFLSGIFCGNLRGKSA
ncbi:MAG: hypothetical protein DYG98_05210 [Haliscomenobacteraceae bacterium CHB4]|nr:hypothetical protein [Haliscomenobacteraceae bacterium CHB4]